MRETTQEELSPQPIAFRNGSVDVESQIVHLSRLDFVKGLRLCSCPSAPVPLTSLLCVFVCPSRVDPSAVRPVFVLEFRLRDAVDGAADVPQLERAIRAELLHSPLSARMTLGSCTYFVFSLAVSLVVYCERLLCCACAEVAHFAVCLSVCLSTLLTSLFA